MLSTATHYILQDRITYRLISPQVESDIRTSWFNQYFIKPLQGEKCSSYRSLVDLSIILTRVFFFASLYRRTNLRFTHCYFHMHVHQCNGCNRCFSSCLWQNVGKSGYAISSLSASAGYSASMLTEVAKVDSYSTRQLLAPSVNISADIQHYLIMTQWIILQ